MSRGIIALDLRENEYLVGVAVTDGNQDVMLFSSAGKAVRFKEAEVRPMSRAAHGVRGIALDDGQRVISMLVAEPGTVLCVTERGYGKRTPIEEFPTKGRGTKGVIAVRTSARNGAQVGAVLVMPEDEIMLITEGGTLVRTAVAGVPVLGRGAQGVRLIRLGDGERLAGVERIIALEDEGPEDTDDEGPGTPEEGP
jgi:DNA gyrase subunit A